jgi:magnesium transporter
MGFRDRFPWLLCNLGGGIACVLLAARFSRLLEAAIIVALFIPVVLTLAESVSIQSTTITLQALHAGRAASALPSACAESWRRPSGSGPAAP